MSAELLIEDKLDIWTVGATRELALEKMDGGGDLTVDVSGADTIDVAGMQLLLALSRDLEGQGRGLYVRGAERLESVCARCGIAPFWTEA